ncbi:MAG: AAA family ATPase [Coriobacteriales bacterium]|jgi:hypothetical protein
MGELALAPSEAVRPFATRFLRREAPTPKPAPTPVDSATTDRPRDVDALLDRMRRSKSWDRISALMYQEPGAGADRSSLDMALCNYLAFYSDGDAGLIDQAFRRSALYRPKWDERHGSDGRTYGQMCIDRAVSDVSSTASDGGLLSTVREATSPGRAKPPRPAPLELVNVADALRDGPPTPDPELISGVLRVGQKMLLSAPPKAGKTWTLLDLAAALATGNTWLGFQCKRCATVYCNLEVSPASFLVRAYQVMHDRQLDPAGAEPVLMFSGRGLNLSAADFVSGLLATWEEAGRPSWGCVIIDTAYMLEDGDENLARDVKPLVAQLDRLGRVIGCALVIAHHHAKGSSGAKASIDRMAGSSVWARWPDALLDLSPLDSEGADDDEALSQQCRDAVREMDEKGASAWRLSFDLREFKARRPLDLYFIDGRFFPDATGALEELPIVGSFEARGRRGGASTRTRSAQERERKAALIAQCVAECVAAGEPATATAVLFRYNSNAAPAGLQRIQRSTLASWLKPTGGFPFHLEPSAEGSVVTPDE